MPKRAQCSPTLPLPSTQLSFWLHVRVMATCHHAMYACIWHMVAWDGMDGMGRSVRAHVCGTANHQLRLAHTHARVGPCMCRTQVLLEHDAATVNYPSMEGDTPLHAAASVGNLDILNLLLGYKPELNVQVGRGGRGRGRGHERACVQACMRMHMHGRNRPPRVPAEGVPHQAACAAYATERAADAGTVAMPTACAVIAQACLTPRPTGIKGHPIDQRRGAGNQAHAVRDACTSHALWPCSLVFVL